MGYSLFEFVYSISCFDQFYKLYVYAAHVPYFFNYVILKCFIGECNCVGTYTGPDCSQNREVPPDIATELSEDSKCDISLTGCNNHYIYGENIIQELCQCKVEEAQVNIEQWLHWYNM